MVGAKDKAMFLEGFGFKLTRLRAEKKKTRKAVCKETGISYTVLANAEAGVADLTQTDLFKLADYYGKTASYLLSNNNINAMYAQEAGVSVQEAEAFEDLLAERGRVRREQFSGKAKSRQRGMRQRTWMM